MFFFFIYLLWGSLWIHGKVLLVQGTGCELTSGVEGTVLNSYWAAPWQRVVPEWPRGSFAAALQGIIRAGMFLSGLAQGTAPTGAVLGGQIVPQAKTFPWMVAPWAGHPKDSPVSNIFYNSYSFLPCDGNWQLTSFRSSSLMFSGLLLLPRQGLGKKMRQEFIEMGVIVGGGGGYWSLS